MSRNPDDLKRQIEWERHVVRRKVESEAQQATYRRKMKRRLNLLAHRIENPRSILDHDDFIDEFLEILESWEFLSDSLNKPDRSLIRAAVNFKNVRTFTREKREKLIEVGRKIHRDISERWKI